VRPFRVVVKPPFFCQFAHLFDVPKGVRIQYRPAIAAIEAFYITVLRRLAWLDELVLVGPDALRLAIDEDDLL